MTIITSNITCVGTELNLGTPPVILTPQDYASYYRMRPSQVAHEHCISENAYRRYLLHTSTRSKPSPITCRVTQLLHFIRQMGAIPPEPFFCD